MRKSLKVFLDFGVVLVLAAGMAACQSMAATPVAALGPEAEKVAQAKALLQDSSYPSAAQVGQIAELLAKNLRP